LGKKTKIRYAAYPLPENYSEANPRLVRNTLMAIHGTLILKINQNEKPLFRFLQEQGFWSIRYVF
jgi:hypothetical protein